MQGPWGEGGGLRPEHGPRPDTAVEDPTEFVAPEDHAGSLHAAAGMLKAASKDRPACIRPETIVVAQPAQIVHRFGSESFVAACKNSLQSTGAELLRYFKTDSLYHEELQ
jgi:hypothetical protein